SRYRPARLGNTQAIERVALAEGLARPRQDARQPAAPGGLLVRRRQQILADLDHRVRQAALLAMNRNGVVGVVIDRIRLVVADAQVRVLAEQGVDQTGKLRIAVILRPGMPWA